MSHALEPYTSDYRVVLAMQDLDRHLSASPLHVSDITDADGHQYVDLVMEGGGVLGIALVGYTWALEQVGIRFASIGGTSAGSINALLMGASAPPNEPRAELVLSTLADLDMMRFVDGGDDARDFVKDIIRSGGMLDGLRMLRAVTRNLPEIVSDCGMNPGDGFRDWLRLTLAHEGVTTTRALSERMNAWPSGMRQKGRAISGDRVPVAKLRVVAADLTMQRKAVFPDEAGLYFKRVDRVDPAQYVRASMSVPYFFEPLRLRDLPSGPRAVKAWREIAGYRGRPPGEILLVDGGIISNFPISLFHAKTTVPRMPTFGAKLGKRVHEPTDAEGALKLAGAMFGLSRQAADAEFLQQNPDYHRLIASIDTGSVNWLNFNLGESEKHQLFAAGVRAAVDFLIGFDWPSYKSLRERVKALNETHERLCEPAGAVVNTTTRQRAAKKKAKRPRA